MQRQVNRPVRSTTLAPNVRTSCSKLLRRMFQYSSFVWKNMSHHPHVTQVLWRRFPCLSWASPVEWAPVQGVNVGSIAATSLETRLVPSAGVFVLA